MAIETTYQAIDWDWFSQSLEQSGDMDFFHELLDDDDEDGAPAQDWREFVLLPASPLWENWRAGQRLAEEIAALEARASDPRLRAAREFLRDVAAIPDLDHDRMLPVADLGPPGSIDPEHLGALSPESTRRLAQRAADLAATPLAALADPGLPAGSLLHRLPAILAEYAAFLRAAEQRGWGVLITAS